jgi:hypothetical protein
VREEDRIVDRVGIRDRHDATGGEIGQHAGQRRAHEFGVLRRDRLARSHDLEETEHAADEIVRGTGHGITSNENGAA